MKTKRINLFGSIIKNAGLLGVFFVLNIAITPLYAASATFAGGCFWCMQHAFEGIPGITKTEAGYTGGHTPNPTYKQVSHGGTGHYEAVRVSYDPEQVTYNQLLKVYWKNIDPLDKDGQFCDRGLSYRSAIFVNDSQRPYAEASKKELMKIQKFKHVVTPILSAGKFYPAEKYHQHYYHKNPIRYKYYRYRCGRDSRLNSLWNDVKF